MVVAVDPGPLAQLQRRPGGQRHADDRNAGALPRGPGGAELEVLPEPALPTTTVDAGADRGEPADGRGLLVGEPRSAAARTCSVVAGVHDGDARRCGGRRPGPRAAVRVRAAPVWSSGTRGWPRAGRHAAGCRRRRRGRTGLRRGVSRTVPPSPSRRWSASRSTWDGRSRRR